MAVCPWCGAILGDHEINVNECLTCLGEFDLKEGKIIGTKEGITKDEGIKKKED